MLKKYFPSVLLLAAGFLLAGCGSPEQKAPENLSDKSVLAFSLPDLAGTNYTLSSFKKDFIIVDFWTTWCPPCRESIPHLNAFYAGNRDRIDVVGISLDTAPSSDVTAFARAMDIEYPVLTGGRDIAVAYGISSIPTLFVVDRKGKIIRRHVGMADTRVLEELVKGL